uniref:Uncharacterized protein n=1 Tax=Triticum urartu TaxID=4572 RepID=A0A8R7U9U4_TRIUA
MVTATVQDLHTVTVGGGRAPTTVLFQHTTAGAILQGAEDGATLAAYRHAGATPAAAPRRQKNQGAVLRGKDAPEARHRAAGHLGRGVPEKAMLTAAVHARGPSPGSAQPQQAPDVLRSARPPYFRCDVGILVTLHVCKQCGWYDRAPSEAAVFRHGSGLACHMYAICCTGYFCVCFQSGWQFTSWIWLTDSFVLPLSHAI